MTIAAMRLIPAFKEQRAPDRADLIAPRGRWLGRVLVSIWMLLVHPAVAGACPVCFGDPNSDMVRGAKWGVAVLGIVVYGLLMGMVGIGVTWFVRARKLQDH